MARQLRLLIVSGAFLLAGFIALFLVPSRPSNQPPPLPLMGEVGNFVVTNQAGARVEAASFRGQPMVVDLIFTRCPGPCRQLTSVLRKIQDGLAAAGSAARLVSVTSDPEFDTPPVLAGYSGKFGADPARWQFVTGDKTVLRDLATRQLKLVLVEKDAAERSGPDDLFLHSTMVVVVDRGGRLRAVVEGLEPGAVEKVLRAVEKVEKEK